jgi:hypothetical protein
VSPILNLEEISGDHLTEYYKIWGRVWTWGNHTSMAISRGIYEFCTHHIDKRWFAKGNHSESCEVLWFSGVWNGTMCQDPNLCQLGQLGSCMKTKQPQGFNTQIVNVVIVDELAIQQGIGSHGYCISPATSYHLSNWYLGLGQLI